jgi:hypothetical protein
MEQPANSQQTHDTGWLCNLDHDSHCLFAKIITSPALYTTVQAVHASGSVCLCHFMEHTHTRHTAHTYTLHTHMRTHANTHIKAYRHV